MRLSKEVLEVLTSKVENQMCKEGLTWSTIQKVDIKSKFGYPMGNGTLFKLIRNPYYYREKQSKLLLKYFNVRFEVVEGVICILSN